MKLTVNDLNSFYGPAHILFDIALEVGEGEVVALLGRNGAGKSTTFRSIVGLVENRSGRIMFEGKDVSTLPTHAIVRGGLGYVPEERRIFTDLTVEENLEVGRQPPRRWPDGSAAPGWTPEALFKLFPNLGEMPNRPGGRMSGGEQQMLAISRALMSRPEVILLDEPSLGLAPIMIKAVFDLIAEEGVRFVETSGRSPEAYLPSLKAAGIKVMHKVPALRYALKAQSIGVDAVAIVGAECGGHPGMDLVGSMVNSAWACDQLQIPYLIGGGIGAAVGGPPGAAVGAVLGTIIGAGAHHGPV